MTDPRDEALARRYRESAREEPPAALDAAILAASRRALARPRSSRWAVPVSLAAVLMLAVGVSLEMRSDQPGVETAPPAPARALPEAPAVPSAAAPREEALRTDRIQRALPAAKESPAAKEPTADANMSPQRSLEKASPAATAAPAARAPVPEARGRVESAIASDPVERLERIARLREQGRDREADAELDRFRRDLPDYRIPDETWERVRPR